MFRVMTITAALITTAATLAPQARAGHDYDQPALLAASCKLKDDACAFEEIICARPVLSFHAYQVKRLRASAERLHEKVKCAAPLNLIASEFDRVCTYASRIEQRVMRSCTIRGDRQLAATWACVLEDIEAVKCLIEGHAVAPPAVGFDFRGSVDPYRAGPFEVHSRRRPQDFGAPQTQARPSPYSHHELLPAPARQLPPPGHRRSVYDERTTRADLIESLIMSLLR